VEVYAVVGSIAAESCKFALLSRSGSETPILSKYVDYKVSELSDIQAALVRYRQHLGAPFPAVLGLAIAAPIHGDLISVTQSGWTVSQEALRAEFGFSQVIALNDAAASGTALGCGDVLDAIPVGGPSRVSARMAPGRYALVNIDFGLGVAAVAIGEQNASRVIDTEAGHLTFAPQNDLEARLADHLRTLHGRVSYERLLAWPALSQIYDIICGAQGRRAEQLSPLEIVLAARAGADPGCAQALKCYSDILGTFAGDVALALGADQAVVLSGRFAYEAHEYVDWTSFRRCFEDKGRLSSVVVQLGTLVLTSPKAVILGVARRVQMEMEGARGGPANPGPAAARPAPPVMPDGPSDGLWQELLDNVSTGVLMLDADRRILASNSRFWEGSPAPVALRQPGVDIEPTFRWMAEAGQWGPAEASSALAALAQHQSYVVERHGAGGAILFDQARRSPSGQWVITSHDVTRTSRRAAELEEIAAELREARNAAEAANRTKSAFLATMSHEIRTPLNGILGMAQAIACDTLSPVQRDRLEIIRQSGESLLAILNDILDLSKIEAGHLELEDAEFDLRQLLLGAYAAFTALANKKGLSFTFEIEPGTDGVYRGDPTRVRQILYNIISNAIKFTASGEVDVRAMWLNDAIQFVISDTGIGVDPERLPALFDRFVQADTSTTRMYGGTGLGLAVCKELAERMGGTVKADSTVGRGSTFTVTLPLKRLDGGARELTAPPTLEAEPGPAPDALPLKVLAAEDNEVNRLVLRTLLHQLGVEVATAEDGEAVLARWEDEPWDVILMDIQMPRMDGVTAARRIRQREAETGRPRVPIVALTANVMSHQIDEYRQAGMDGHVAKPIQAAELFSALLAEVEKQDRLSA
jgi:glucokinase